MSVIFDYLFASAAFVPHGVCLLWRPDLVALHGISDTLIALAYLAIPAAIAVFVSRRKYLSADAKRTAGLFVLFIVFCALTHIAAAVTIWYPAYGAQGIIKAMTAVISVATAILIWPQIPKLLALPSRAQLEAANRQLAATNVGLETSLAEQSHNLDSTRKRFGRALEGSNITVFEQDRDLRYRWIHNPRLGRSVDDTVGRTDEELLPKESAEPIIALKKEVMQSGERKSMTVTIPSEAEGPLHVELYVQPTRDLYGAIDGVLCSVLDLTERHFFEVRLASLNAMLAVTSKRFELALENSLITVFEQDLELRYTYIHNPPDGTEESDYIGKTDEDLFEPEECEKLVPHKRDVIKTGTRKQFEVTVTLGGIAHTYDLMLEPMKDEAGGVTGIIGTAIDITARRQSEDQLRLVMRELTHRSKNLLAVIQAMARQTAARSLDTDSFVSTFSARLRAMAASHDLLVSHSWYGAEIRELVMAHLAQSIDPDTTQVVTEGPALRVNSDTAQNLGLALHELTTNAAKYGALSNPDGCVNVAWAHENGEVTLSWKETGGPAVSKPERKGFGSVLLERSVGQSLGGSVTVDYQPDGLECTITFPEDRLM